MSQNIYQNIEQNTLKDRMTNTDPREVSSEIAPQAGLQAQPLRKRSTGRTLVICALALALAFGILRLTGSIWPGSMQKTLPARSFTVNGHGSLVINNDSGTFHIHAGAGHQVVIRGTEYVYGLVSNFNGIHVQYQQQDNAIMLTAREDWNMLGNSSVTMDITVPANLDVIIRGSSTDADLTNIEGQVTASTSSGNIHVNNVQGGLNLNVTSGNIVIVGEQGAVSAHTSSGNIDISQLTGPVDLSTTSGNITLDQANISGQDRLQTGSGNIRFTGSLDTHGSYEMKTTSGNITLNLPANSSFQASTSTTSGDVTNAFSSLSIGSDPHATLVLKTTSGNIHLQKQ